LDKFSNKFKPMEREKERERKRKKEKAPLSLLSSTIIINKEAENCSSFCNKCEE
jgi:hypothetical protein